jgi:hypothetical protein
MADRLQCTRTLWGRLWVAAAAFVLGWCAIATAADLGPDLLAAARKGQTEQVAALLARGAPIESADKDGRTALMIAAQHGHAGTVKLLLDRGAKVDARDRQGWTAYALALTGGRDEVVKLFPRSEPVRASLEVTWVPDNIYSSCLMTPQQLAQQIAGLQPDAVVAAAIREYAAVNGKAAMQLVEQDPQVKVTLKVRPGVSCVQQQSADNLNLAIDAKVLRVRDGAILLEKTFGGGLKGLHARAATSPAQYGPVFSEWAKTHAAQIYWAIVEAWLRAR